jgi:anti-sigma factor RsiW
MSDYLDGELTASERSRMERHARDCPECKQLIAGLRAVVAGLRRLPAPEGSTDATALATVVRARLDEPPEQ